MFKVKPLQLIILAMIILFILLPFIGLSSTENFHDGKRPDRIKLDSGTRQIKEDMPAVNFLHDLHTSALDDKCTVCHLKKEDGLVFKFKRTDKKPSMDFYHAQCIACHVEKKAAKKKSGPLTEDCRSCHISKKSDKSSWQKINFDKSLHFRHISSKSIRGNDISSKDNCSACHHQYNEKTKKIFYAEGKEESCGYCHKPEPENDIRSIRKASHDACVKCHQTLKIKDIDAGPVTCNGCHDIVEQKKIQIISQVPRLKRNQPDVVVLTTLRPDSSEKINSMKAVVFDHELHETKTLNCKSCHHETLKKCSDCHTQGGGKLKGGFVSLEKAMHSTDNNTSCIGCHREATRKPDCAGCHFQVPATRNISDSCIICHSLQQEKLQSMAHMKAAKKLPDDRSSTYTPVMEDKIPGEVKIDDLVNDYLPARFPHRKMVQAIFKRVEKSGLANAFHTDQAGLCMGCHHNSPKSLEPPQCASCHNKKGPGPDGRPGLKGAYHGQCITCHQKMNVKSVAATDCAKCHEEKKKEISMDIKNKG